MVSSRHQSKKSRKQQKKLKAKKAKLYLKNSDGDQKIRLKEKIDERIAAADLFVSRVTKQDQVKPILDSGKDPIVIASHKSQSSGDEFETPKNDSVEELKNKIESGDEDEVFYETISGEEINYEQEYNQFLQFLSSAIESSTGIMVKTPQISFETFKKFLKIYGSREMIEQNFQLQFQPQVIIQKNVCKLTTSVGDVSEKSTETRGSICVANEETFIYPNELTFA